MLRRLLNYTSPEAQKILDEFYAKLSGEERMRIGSEMFETARKIVLSSFPPNLPENEIRKRLFLRFYRNDFSKEEKVKILKRMDEEFKEAPNLHRTKNYRKHPYSVWLITPALSPFP